MVLKISTILEKARHVKNSCAPINNIPPETLALVGTFLAKERDLINATAVCRHWRTILLSFPRLWCNPGGSLSELEAYLERSKSIPIEVNLSHPQLVASIIPHTSRLVALAVDVDDLPGFDEVLEHLRDPIPTLRSLEVLTRNPYLDTLELPSGLHHGLFMHLKKFSLSGISSFRGSQAFPHITELSVCTNLDSLQPEDLLRALGRLPGLEKVHVLFQSVRCHEIHQADVVTLPCVREMCLTTSDVPAPPWPVEPKVVPPILLYLKLPKVTSLTVQLPPTLLPVRFILPITSFTEHLPNYIDLPELRVETTASSAKLTFRSSSQAVFTCHTRALHEFQQEYQLWGGLPLSSVRRVAAVLEDPILGDEDKWLADLLRELGSLELLELGGDCGWVLRRFRRRIARGAMWVRIGTLIVRGGEYVRDQALKLENVKDELGLGDMTMTYVPDPESQGV